MATNLLTDIQCKNATSEGKAIRKLHDGQGLYLWVYADGRKYWRLRYWQGSKEKSLSLGVYPATSLKQARKGRADQQGHLAAGLDPSAERQADKRAKALAAVNTFEAVAREWYSKQVGAWSERHAQDVTRRLESNLFPTLGKRPIGEIDPPELLATVRRMEARGATDLAHRVLAMAGQVFRYGIAIGACTRDPSADLRGALTVHVKQNQPAVKEKGLPDLMRAIVGYEGDKQTRLALQLLALTFVRTGELIGATWDEFDLENALWVIPAERMKMKNEHLVPLSKQALAILHELKAMNGDSRFVFPGRSRGKPISNNTLLFALYRLGFKGRMTGHGFRAVASTILNESGFSPDVVERQLAHCERDKVRGAYNRAQYLKDRTVLMQWWADRLDEIAGQ